MTARWTVNRSQFIDNVKHVAGTTPVMAVIKNNAYHFGLDFAVDAFTQAGLDTFSTTNISEAVHVRKLCPDATIFLVNPTDDFETVKRYDLHMTLPSKAFYHQYRDDLAQVKVHLEYENLLHRSGFKTAADLEEIIMMNESLPKAQQMNITGLWTHFGYADEFEVEHYHVEKTNWLTVMSHLSDQFDFKFIHAQNSASFVRDGLFDDHTHARLGIILYGARPYSSLPETITAQSLTVSANVIQVRELQPGESAGYSFAYTAEAPVQLAVVDIGYGDGILRTRSQFDCIIIDRRYPIRALMMSHMFVEVDHRVTAGDEVIIYSNNIRIDEFTFKGVGANSEQLSALNHNTLQLEMIE